MEKKKRAASKSKPATVKKILSAFGDIHIRGEDKDALKVLVEQFLAAKLAGQAKAFKKIQVCLEDGQGGLYPAATQAAPLLLQLAGMPATPMRERIISFVVMLPLGLQRDWLQEGFDSSRELESKWFATERKAHTTYKRLLALIDVLITCLADQASEVRAAAAFGLAWFGEDAEKVREAIIPALESETDACARASQILCLGLQGNYLDIEEDVELLTAHLDDDDQRVRVAAAYALMYLPVGQIDGRVFSEVRQAHTASPWPEFPWQIFRGPRFDFTLDRLMAFVEVRRAQVIDTLLEIMEDVEVEHPEVDGPKPLQSSYRACNELRDLLFPAGFDSLKKGDLTVEQDRFIRCALEAPMTSGLLSLPEKKIDMLRALVGLVVHQSTSVLDRSITLGGAPGSIREFWEAHGHSGMPSTEELSQAMAELLSPQEAVEALVDGGRFDGCVAGKIEAIPATAGLPANWPATFPIVDGGKAQQSYVGGALRLAYKNRRDDLLASYWAAFEPAGWHMLWEEKLPDVAINYGMVERAGQRVLIDCREEDPVTWFGLSRSWHLAPTLVSALIDKHGTTFHDALTERAVQIAAGDKPTKDNPNPGSRQMLAAVAQTASRLHVEIDPAFDTLAIYAHDLHGRNFRLPLVAAYLRLLPLERREQLAFILLDLDEDIAHVAGYAAEVPTPGMIERVMDRCYRKGLPRHLAPVGPPIVPSLLERASDLTDPRRIIYSNALAMIGQPAAAALLSLLDDDDKTVREHALKGLSRCALDDVEPVIRELLADSKKVRRELGATMLKSLSPSKAGASLAAEALATEKTASVKKLLEEIAGAMAKV